MKFLIIFISIILFADDLKNIFSLLPDVKKEIVKKKKEKTKFPLYAKLSLDLLRLDKNELSQLINSKKPLPFRDKLVALIKLNRINEAKKLAYNNLRDSDDYLTYKQVRDFYMTYANRFKTENRYIKSDRSYFENKNSLKIYLLNGKYGYFHNINYFSKEDNVNIVKFGIKELLQRGYNYFEAGEKNSKSLFLFRNYLFYKNIYITSSLGRESADESRYLLFNALKTSFKESIDIKLKNRYLFRSSVSINFYKDKKYLGKSLIFNFRYVEKLRFTYPDFNYYIFSNFNFFSKDKNLPPISYEGGAGMFFGLDDKEIYHHTLKPFIDVYFNYNNKFKSSLNFLIGASKRFYRKDNLSISFRYTTSLNGAKNFEYGLNYSFWF